MGRSIATQILVRAQADFYSAPGVRATGILAGSLNLSLFFNNALTSWALRDGTTIQDSTISAGNIYFNEIAGSPGFYSVRFYPDKVGFWRIVLNDVALTQENIIEIDIVSAATTSPGLIASFTR
jgi:hypothetical protein